MPRYYGKYDKKIDFEAVVEAIKQMDKNEKSIRVIAKTYNVPRATLSRYMGKLQDANIDVSTASDDTMITFLKGTTITGAKPIFSDEEEQALLKYLLHASDIYYGLSISELRALAFQYAVSIKRNYPESWDKKKEASKDWYYSFMNRHPNLSLRKPEQVSQNRVKAFTKEKVDAFFDNFRSVLNATKYEVHRIWNMDETGLPTVPNKVVKVIAQKGRKRIGTSTSAERGTNVTMALSVSASGLSIPPFYIFPRKNIKAIFMTHASHGAEGVANGSGWMTAEVFLQYMDHFIKFSGAHAGSPTLLLVDNHASHLSIEVIEKALAHDITMLSFPPHCTHRMQPLDVSVFGPLKMVYAQKHDDWKRANVGVLYDLHHVPLIVDQCLDIAVTPKNIKSGFKSCGIFPFNANIFTEIDFISSELSGEDQCDGNGEENRDIMVTNRDVHEKVTTSESSAGASTSGTSSSASLSQKLRQSGPLKKGTPAEKSNRGRKPMRSAILTSPDFVTELREKAAIKRKKEEEAKKTPAPKRRTRSQPARRDSSDDEDVDFCILCLESMPKKLTKNNSVACMECGRDVHAKCATSANTFTCPNCVSD